MKIGLITCQNHVSQIHFDFISQLLRNDTTELSFIKLRPSGNALTFSSPAKNVLKDSVRLRYQAGIERKLISKLFKSEPINKNWPLSHFKDVKVLDVVAEISEAGTQIPLNWEELKLLKAEDFDLLISLCGKVIIPRLSELENLEILRTSVDSAPHRTYSLEGFWNVYKQQPSTGFRICSTSGGSAEESLIFEGFNGTRDLCWQYNYLFLQKACYRQLTDIIAKLGKGQSLRRNPIASSNNKQEREPSWHQLIKYQWTMLRTVIGKLRARKLKIDDYWTVYFSEGSSTDLDFNMVRKIENPNGSFFADPFIYRYDNRDIIFVEEYLIREKKAVISALEVTEDKSTKYLGQVIREPFHLSYPFIFEYDNELYMIPESSGAKSIRLYKCESFPMQWNYQYDLIANIDAADTTIVPWDNRYWLLTNLKGQDGEHNSILVGYVADSPISKTWKAHEHNPIQFGNGARNGGLVWDDRENTLISQTYGFNVYGKSLQIKRLKTLSEHEFKTEVIKEIEPEVIKGAEGIHHLSSNGHYTVFDVLKKRSLE